MSNTSTESNDPTIWFVEDLRGVILDYFENLMSFAGIDTTKPYVVRYTSGLTDIATQALLDAMAAVIEDAKAAEAKALSQYENYSGLSSNLR